MRILVVGASGTIGGAVTDALEARGHEVARAGHSGGGLRADLADKASIAALYRTVGRLDAVVCTAGVAKFGALEALDDADFARSIDNKLMGQVNLVRLGLGAVAPGGSFTLTSGTLTVSPTPGTCAVAMVGGAVEAFARAAALDLEGRLDLLEQVGSADVFRYFMVIRSPDSHLNFDLDTATETDWQKNPVFYIQYAHARMCSIFAKAGLRLEDVRPGSADLGLLTHELERELLKRLGEFPGTVERAAEGNHPAAQHALATLLRTGEGGTEDLQRAAELLEAAAQQGHMSAQFDLGQMVRRGEGVEASLIKAIRLYRAAADQGHTLAQYNLAFLLSHAPKPIASPATAVQIGRAHV